MEYVSVRKIGKVLKPHDSFSTFGDSKKEHIGLFIKVPQKGEKFMVQGVSDQEEGIITSVVTKIVSDNTFETQNSIYKWEFIANITNKENALFI